MVKKGGCRNKNLFGLNGLSWNDGEDVLFDKAVEFGEGKITKDKALSVMTGKYTGRSVGDKFIVKEKATKKEIWWDNNAEMSEAAFACLFEDFLKFGKEKKLFVQDLIAGADKKYGLKVRIVSQFAWHALFIRHLLREPEKLDEFVPELTIFDLPDFKAEPRRHQCRSEVVIAMHLSRGTALIGGTGVWRGN